jgi:MFS family permease
VGIGVGIASVVAPMLLSEIAAPGNRGIITTFAQLSVTASIFTAAVVAYGLVTTINHGWQYVLGLGALPAIFFIVFYPYVPESPKWLAGQNRVEEAKLTLLHLRQTQRSEAVDQELQEILNEVISSDSGSGSSVEGKRNEVSWSDVLVYRRSVIIGCGLMFYQAMTGINTVIFYSTSIFSFAGFEDSILATTLVTLTNVIATIVCASLIDKYGRKFFLRIGGWIMLISLTVLSCVLISGGSGTAGLVGNVAPHTQDLV